jgi:hypothetical protein
LNLDVDFKFRKLLPPLSPNLLENRMTDEESKSNSEQPNLRDLISFEEASRLSGFTDRHLRKLASQNVIWAVKLGRNWFTTVQAVSEYLAKDRKPGPKSQKDHK